MYDSLIVCCLSFMHDTGYKRCKQSIIYMYWSDRPSSINLKEKQKHFFALSFWSFCINSDSNEKQTSNRSAYLLPITISTFCWDETQQNAYDKKSPAFWWPNFLCIPCRNQCFSQSKIFQRLKQGTCIYIFNFCTKALFKEHK